MLHRRRQGFTLIELLIVVAIIAILAAIAVPNFLEAQVRAKVSRTKNDMRSMATALESYRVDTNKYPPDGRELLNLGWTQEQVNAFLLLQVLTTPVAYMTSIPDDTFPNRWLGASREQEVWARSYTYNGQAQKDLLWALNTTVRQYGKQTSHIWALNTDGPNRLPNYGSYMVFGEDCLNHIFAWERWGCQYDPTNGTVSAGDIVRVGP